MNSRAAVFYGAGQPLEVRDIELDEPRPTDVVVRMSAVGICGTELHSIRGEWERPTPSVLGHEGAGVVEAVGDAVTCVAAGRRGRPLLGTVVRRLLGLPSRPARGVHQPAPRDRQRHARRRDDRDDDRRRDALPRHGDRLPAGAHHRHRALRAADGRRGLARGGGAARLRGDDRRRGRAVRRAHRAGRGGARDRRGRGRPVLRPGRPDRRGGRDRRRRPARGAARARARARRDAHDHPRRAEGADEGDRSRRRRPGARRRRQPGDDGDWRSGSPAAAAPA